MNDLFENVFVNLKHIQCGDTPVEVSCDERERTISFANYITLPDENINPDVEFKECCYEFLVLGDNTGKKERNDYFGVYHQRQLPNDTCTFELEQMSPTSSTTPIDEQTTLGTFKSFGSITENVDLAIFIINWGLVFNEMGEGAYRINKTFNVAGIEFTESTPVFNLKEFSYLHADKTIRMDVSMNGLLESQNVDFTNSSFESSIRVRGFFGRREPKMEQDNIVYKNKKVNQISMKQTNSYQMQTELLPECITTIIFDVFIFADDIFMNDYNLVNHSYKFINKSVVFEKNNGTGYSSLTRKARVNLVFNDRFKNRNKYNY